MAVMVAVGEGLAGMVVTGAGVATTFKTTTLNAAIRVTIRCMEETHAVLMATTIPSTSTITSIGVIIMAGITLGVAVVIGIVGPGTAAGMAVGVPGIGGAIVQ